MSHTTFRVGRLTCHALEGGTQRLDGGAMFGVVPKPLWQRRIPADEQLRASRDFLSRMSGRRSVLLFSPEPVPLELIENALRCASLAPSGANQHPWGLVVVQDADIKHKIREAAEAEERESYQRRMPAEWLEALAPLGTDWHKEFLEVAS